MTAEQSLIETYASWRRLAEAEGEAIRSSDWQVVAECQNTLRELQPHIIGLTDKAQKEWAISGADRQAKEEAVRSIVRKLIEQEQRNSALLNSLLESTRVQLGELEQTSQNLKRLQRSYSPARPCMWTSFS